MIKIHGAFTVCFDIGYYLIDRFEHGKKGFEGKLKWESLTAF